MDELTIGSLSIVISAVTTILVMPWIMRREQKKSSREQLLLRVLNSWLTPANPEYQAAIAAVSVVFSGESDVLEKRDLLLAYVNDEDAARRSLTDFDKEAQSRQANLIEAMSKAVGIRIPAKQLLQSIYLTKGFVERENTLLGAYQAWPRIADALERNNLLYGQLLSDQRSQLQEHSERPGQ